MPGGTNTADHEITARLTKRPLVKVFVGCAMGFAFLTFLICTRNRYFKRGRDRVRHELRDDMTGDEKNMQRFLDWKKTHPRSSLYHEDHLNKGHVLSEWNITICAICLDVVRGYDTIYQLKCLHVFHFGCAKTWYDREPGRTCPICRTGSSSADNVSRSFGQSVTNLKFCFDKTWVLKGISFFAFESIVTYAI
ncbi:hypothetical protein WAI453_006422 [Rhynchosporium graminicola]